MGRRTLVGALLMEVVVATSLLGLVGFLVLQLFASSRLLHHQSLMRAKALELGTARLLARIRLSFLEAGYQLWQTTRSQP